MRITVDEGARINWHTHPGPVIVTVQAGELTYVNADDCVHRKYRAGTVFLDPGQGNVHAAYNSFAGETILVATFLGVEEDATVPTTGPSGCPIP
jgi:quercetin dioxygenase-like cupin family protein